MHRRPRGDGGARAGESCACVRWAVTIMSCPHKLNQNHIHTHSQSSSLIFTSNFFNAIPRSKSHLSPSRLYILCQYIWHIVWSSAKEKHNKILRRALSGHVCLCHTRGQAQGASSGYASSDWTGPGPLEYRHWGSKQEAKLHWGKQMESTAKLSGY